jgi:hypothetical protein
MVSLWMRTKVKLGLGTLYSRRRMVEKWKRTLRAERLEVRDVNN